MDTEGVIQLARQAAREAVFKVLNRYKTNQDQVDNDRVIGQDIEEQEEEPEGVLVHNCIFH